MVQSPSWEANWFAASQEISRISRNPKVHYRNHKRPPPVSILGQPNPVHIPTSHLLEIHLNIIHPSTPMSPQWSLSLRFPHHDPIYPHLLTHTRHMPSPSHEDKLINYKSKATFSSKIRKSIIPSSMKESHVRWMYSLFWGIFIVFCSGTVYSENVWHANTLLNWMRQCKHSHTQTTSHASKILNQVNQIPVLS